MTAELHPFPGGYFACGPKWAGLSGRAMLAEATILARHRAMVYGAAELWTFRGAELHRVATFHRPPRLGAARVVAAILTGGLSEWL